jgi:hypothetical protein
MALTIDDLVPGPDFASHHELRVAAPPAVVWDALQHVSLGGAALSRALTVVAGGVIRRDLLRTISQRATASR